MHSPGKFRREFWRQFVIPNSICILALQEENERLNSEVEVNDIDNEVSDSFFQFHFHLIPDCSVRKTHAAAVAPAAYNFIYDRDVASTLYPKSMP